MKILFLISFLFIFSCKPKNEELKSKNKEDFGVNSYVKFDFANPKAIVMNCAKGRVNARLRYYEKTAVEVHKSFLKYVDFEPKGDTLFINTSNWPSEEKSIRKQINIYLPKLDYLETELTSFTLMDYNSHNLKIKSQNTAFRLSKCRIENFNIDLSQRTNMYVDGNCAFDRVNARTDKSTILTFYGHVSKEFHYKSPNLDKLGLRNLSPNTFKWTK